MERRRPDTYRESAYRAHSLPRAFRRDGPNGVVRGGEGDVTYSHASMRSPTQRTHLALTVMPGARMEVRPVVRGAGHCTTMRCVAERPSASTDSR